MLLRESGEQAGTSFELDAVTGGGDVEGVGGAAVLVAFAEAIVTRDPGATVAARDAVTRQLGPASMVDAAAVASNFERMVRIADSTGIVLGDRLEEPTAVVRETLGLDRFAATTD